MTAPASPRLPQLPLQPGDCAPWFRAPALSGSDAYAFDTVAGRHVLLLFFDSAATAEVGGALELVQLNRSLFDDEQACFFGISADPQDAAQGRIAQQLPGIRYFLDYQRQLSRLYGACDEGGYRPTWLLLDPALRVIDSFDLASGEAAIGQLRRSLAADRGEGWAPVLLVPKVFPQALCDELIAGYEREGGRESGFMREVSGKTVLLTDPLHKQRRDWAIEEQALRQRLLDHVRRGLSTPIERAFQFRATRLERYIVGCYEAGAGHFRPHRDNTTRGTAHRRFAVTINLNAGDHDGGDLRFPEFGSRTYRAPTGGAVVFSCSLLHEATPVTRGRRYAFLPFLYDEQAARVREANNPHLGEGLGAYSAR